MYQNTDNIPAATSPKEESLLTLIADIEHILEKREENLPVHHTGKRLLRELAENDGCTQLELVHVTGLKPPTVSVTLQKLEKDGYVCRKPDLFDLRMVRVFLTDKGRQLSQKMKKKRLSDEEYVTLYLTKDEKNTLQSLLTNIREHLTEE